MRNSIRSGTKYRTPQGFVAIRDGVTGRVRNKLLPTVVIDARPRKPPWLRVHLPQGAKYQQIRSLVEENSLHTVCAESHCPNIGECWSNGTATLMLMGSVCTRACNFCAVDTGNPHQWLDANEPANSAKAVSLMNLKYVVLTSVDRDDLPDGGATHYAACIEAIHDASPSTTIEALTPDFQGNFNSVDIVVNTPLAVFAQNIETVRRLTSRVRDSRAGYDQTLAVLHYAKNSGVATKSSLMLGLGETEDELVEAFEDLRNNKVDFLTLGQYLRPTKNHLPVERWVHPNEFERYREIAMNLGFIDVASGPLVRSSYRADQLVSKLNH